MKKLDKNKVIGYRLDHDSYTGYYIDSVTVYDFIWWCNHNNGKRLGGNINWLRSLILVSEEVFLEYRRVSAIRVENQVELRKLQVQYDTVYTEMLKKITDRMKI